ncbi:MAG: aspartate kinase [Christensenellales bacterium]
MGTKVVKFGGSSLADSKQFKKVKKIILSDNDRRFVIPSAPGKRDYADEKITDMLYACAQLTGEDREVCAIFTRIEERYGEIKDKLGLKIDIEKHLDKARTDILNGAGRDYAASRGEYFNALLLADYLGFEFLDAADVIFFKQDGTLDSAKTQQVLSSVLKTKENSVIPGFYGSMPDGSIKTFSRGGSDITGAIVARAAFADVYENWTDVSGFLMADPRIVMNPRSINMLTYAELRELSYMGATVLHEESIFPVKKAGIPINVKNTNFPDEKGTMIYSEIPKDVKLNSITGVAGRKGFTIVSLEKDMMNAQYGFVRRVLTVLEDLGISFEHMPTGIDTLCLIISDSQLEGKLDMLLDGLRSEIDPDRLEVTTDLALIATVGYGMIRRPGISAKLFGALAAKRINVRMIDQGSSELNIIVGVAGNDFEEAVRAIYEAFID